MEELLRDNFWLIPILAVIGWSIVLSFIARVSGWSELAEHYAALDSYDGQKRAFQTISMERWKVFPSNYGGVVEFGADARGLHISLFILFRPFHPPLVIPWSDLRVERRQVLLWTQTALVAARAPGVTVVIQGPAADWIAAQSGGLFAVPTSPSSRITPPTDDSWASPGRGAIIDKADPKPPTRPSGAWANSVVFGGNIGPNCDILNMVNGSAVAPRAVIPAEAERRAGIPRHRRTRSRIVALGEFRDDKRPAVPRRNLSSILNAR